MVTCTTASTTNEHTQCAHNHVVELLNEINDLSLLLHARTAFIYYTVRYKSLVYSLNFIYILYALDTTLNNKIHYRRPIREKLRRIVVKRSKNHCVCFYVCNTQAEPVVVVSGRNIFLYSCVCTGHWLRRGNVRPYRSRDRIHDRVA